MGCPKFVDIACVSALSHSIIEFTFKEVIIFDITEITFSDFLRVDCKEILKTVFHSPQLSLAYTQLRVPTF